MKPGPRRKTEPLGAIVLDKEVDYEVETAQNSSFEMWL
jgi:hypothetical protein